MTSNFDDLVAHITAIHHRTKKRSLPLETYTAAAVLIPVFLKNELPYLLFTKRTSTVRHHKGQISFPGGAMDSSDASLTQTALRETHEEIGVEPEDVRVLAELDDMVTPTQFRVTPFVGIIPYPYEFKVNTEETEELIEVPWNHLINPANRRVGTKAYKKRTYQVHYFHYLDHVIWGVTGNIIDNLILTLTQ